MSFGSIAGRETWLYTLDNGKLRARIADYGGILVSLEVPAPFGKREHVVLGFENIEAYGAASGSFGALLGRTANRIADGRMTIEGQTYELSKNENDSTLHGGSVGFERQFWSVTSADDAQLVLTLTSPDGDQGFPGTVNVTATYRLVELELCLTFEATTTAPTPLSLSAHFYFNLDGPGSRDCLDHQIEILADAFLPTDKRQIPSGERRKVSGTAFDFTTPRRIGSRIREESEDQLGYGRGYDHYFILPQGDGVLRLAARVQGASGIHVLEILTNQPGLQFYTGNNLNGSARGRGGYYRQSAGFALEPQGFPNAVNQPDFPTNILRPGRTYREEIVYRFVVPGERAAS